MKIDKISRKYNLNDADFLFLMDKIIKQLQKDILVVQKYGIDEEKIAYVRDLCNRIKFFLPDDVQICDIMGKTQAMEAAYRALIIEIRMIIARAKACFGAKSAFVKNLGMSDMNKFAYDTLIQSSKAMIPTLEMALPELEEYGFTAETIAELSDKIKAFEDARLAQNQMKNARINATIDRKNLSNELYEKVAMYAEIAKAVFANTDSIKYKQYLLSKGSKKIPEAEIAKNN